jgi:hypothetical protein
MQVEQDSGRFMQYLCVETSVAALIVDKVVAGGAAGPAAIDLALPVGSLSTDKLRTTAVDPIAQREECVCAC